MIPLTIIMYNYSVISTCFENIDVIKQLNCTLF